MDEAPNQPAPGQRPAAYFERLRRRVAERRSALCVGLDPDPDLIPGGLDGALEHCLGVIEQTRDLVACYKPNAGYWERYGPDGWRALVDLRSAIGDVPVLFDAKRGDIPESMRAYVEAAFDGLGMDALTVSPFLGTDALMAAAAWTDRGIYVLVHTSNRSAPDLQELDTGGEPLYLRVADLVAGLPAANLAMVVGATYPEPLARVRRRAPGTPFLVPGVGAQGGAPGGGAGGGLERGSGRLHRQRQPVGHVCARPGGGGEPAGGADARRREPTRRVTR